MRSKNEPHARLGTRSGNARRLALTALTVMTLGASTLVVAAPASADYFSGGMGSRSWTVKPVGINDTWIGYLDSGRSRWNNSGSGTSIGRSTSAANTFTAGNYTGQSWYGHYVYSGVRGINRTFTIQLNATSLAQDAGSNLTLWSLSTATHELGHGLSLTDDPNTTAVSLMKHDRNRTLVGSPTAYDVSEVLRIY